MPPRWGTRAVLNANAATVAAAAGTNSRALWYLTRGFGLIALVLLTATVVMGLTQVVRYARPGLPRFVIAALHKNVSILAVVFLAVHVTTAVADTYAPISIVSVFVPFAGEYRPIWLGFGALALDLLVALVVTSLVRERIGQRTWRALHWAAYLCWPVAIVHGLGTGSDTKLGWVLALNALCMSAGIVAIWWRLARGWVTAVAGRRTVALLGTLIAPGAVALWMLSGPLHAGWAKRSGTPASLLGSSTPALRLPFTSRFSGTQSEHGVPGGHLVTIVMTGTFSRGTFDVTLTGEPLGHGTGVELTTSNVTIGPDGDGSEYRGHVTSLKGDTIVSTLRDQSGRAVIMTVDLPSAGGSSIAGTVQVSR